MSELTRKEMKELGLNFIRETRLKQPVESPISEEQDRIAASTIEAIDRSEKSSLIYSAACFAPVLGMIASVQSLASINHNLADLFVMLAFVLLGISGFYFATYKVISLTPKRIIIEFYRAGIVDNYDIILFPQGKWYTLNKIIPWVMFTGFLSLVAYFITTLLLV